MPTIRGPNGGLIDSIGVRSRWLSETELADAYRPRAALATDEAARLDRLVEDAVRNLDPETPWLVTVLVPGRGPRNHTN